MSAPSNQLASSTDARIEFLTALGITALICLLFILSVRFWGVQPEISTAGYYALWGTFIALVLKMLISDSFNRKFEWHKHGYDMCIMALGTSLTTLAYVVSKDKIERHQLLFVGVLFIFSMVATFIAGGNSRAIEASAVTHPLNKNVGLKWINITLGVIAIGMNLYVIVLKDPGAKPKPAHAIRNPCPTSRCIAMILLLLLMAGAITIPLTIEAVRSPTDNLLRDTRTEIVESIIEPAQARLEVLLTEGSGRLQDAFILLALARLFAYVMRLITSFLK